MPPENYKAYIPLEHAIGGRKTRGAGVVILVRLLITYGAQADHCPDITAPVWRRIVEAVGLGESSEPPPRFWALI